MTLPTSFAGCRSAITCVRIVSRCNAPGLPLARAARVEREGYIRVVDDSYFLAHGGVHSLMRPSHRLLLFSSHEYSKSGASSRVNTRSLLHGLV